MSRDETFVADETAPFSIERLALDRAKEVVDLYYTLLAGRDCGERSWMDWAKSASVARWAMLRSARQWERISVEFEEMDDWPIFPSEEEDVAPAGYREKALAMKFEDWILEEIASSRNRLALVEEYKHSRESRTPRLTKRDRRFINLVLMRCDEDVRYLVKATSGYQSEKQRLKAVSKEIRTRTKSG
jgi:molybdopterin-guanine dinucleotide biosynthesis protein